MQGSPPALVADRDARGHLLARAEVTRRLPGKPVLPPGVYRVTQDRSNNGAARRGACSADTKVRTAAHGNRSYPTSVYLGGEWDQQGHPSLSRQHSSRT